ncbi:MAG: type-F conjugative transfer system pilin assembly protein TrbC [Gammaproteobacteria bacterium]
MSAIRTLLLVLCLTLTPARAFEINISDEMREKARQTAEMGMRESTAAKASALKIKAILESPEWKEKENRYKSDISKILKIEQPKDREAVEIASINRPVLFMSKSIPLITLRRYAIDLAKIGGVMVLQGGVEGLKQLGPTMQFTADILKVDPSCQQDCKMHNTTVLIDPILFRANQIKVVPALIYQRELNVESHCIDGGKPQPATHVVYGDASIRGLLEALYELSNDHEISKLIEVF